MMRQSRVCVTAAFAESLDSDVGRGVAFVAVARLDAVSVGEEVLR